MEKRLLYILIATISGVFIACQTNPDKPKDEVTYFRGFSIDAARTVESMEHYHRIVDFSVEWGFNCLVFRITDDEGSAYQFRSHPELKTHVGAYSKDELTEFINYAGSKGIEVIPEIESFGHTKYITEVERYKFLEDILDPTIEWANGICPVSDTTLNLMKDLYTEIVEIFPSEYLHIGCDETNWGGNEMTKLALKEKSKNEIWSEYVNQLNCFVKDLGKTAIIWGDVPIREENEILELLEKDIVIMDWNYWLTDKNEIKNNADKLLENEFEIIGAPAVNWMMWGPRIGEFQLENIKAFRSVYSNIEADNNLGIILTHWCPYRYLQNGQWDSYALAAEILNQDTFVMETSLKKFTENHYGAAWNEDWEKIYSTLYTLTPKNKYHEQDYGVIPFYPWRNRDDLEEIFSRHEPIALSFSETIELLKYQTNNITRNHLDYSELLLTVEYMEHLIWRENAIFELKTSPDKLGETLTEIAGKDLKMLDRLISNWEKGRKGEISEQHLWDFPRAVEYSAKLAKNNSEPEEVLSEFVK